MTQLRKDIILDRAVMISLAMWIAKYGLKIADQSAARTLLQNYARLIYESTGMSAIERILRGYEPISKKLVCVSHHVTLDVGSDEKSLLTATVAEAVRIPRLLHALDRFATTRMGSAHPREDVLGYVVRLLLLGRQLKADILPWKARGDIIVALFEESELKWDAEDTIGRLHLLRSEPCCFPYLPPIKEQEPLHRFGILLPEVNLFDHDLCMDEISTAELDSPFRDVLSPINSTQDSGEFDVFIAYNAKDKDQVKKIAERLRAHGLLPWFDDWELRPGMPWQDCLQEQIQNIKAVAVFIGPRGVGPWEDLEVKAFIEEFVLRKCPIIPVLLPGRKRWPKLPPFLKMFHGVDFNKPNPDPFRQLVYGITGKRD